MTYKSADKEQTILRAFARGRFCSECGKKMEFVKREITFGTPGYLNTYQCECGNRDQGI